MNPAGRPRTKESQKMGCKAITAVASSNTLAFRVALRAAVLGIFLLSGLACSSDVDIVHGMTELEANEVLVVLDSQGIAARKIKEEGRIVTWAVIVPESASENALRILVRNKLPKTRSQGLAQVYPAGSGGLIPTQTEEKAKFLMAIQGEIEMKLKSFPGVVQAHVSVVTPAKDVIRDVAEAPSPATASVALVYNLQENGETPITMVEVQTLVAAAVEDLKPEQVQVVLKENQPLALVDMESESGNALAESTTAIFGIKVVNEKAKKRATNIIVSLLVLWIVGLVLALVFIWRAIAIRKKLAKAEAEAAALKKAGRELQE